MLNSVNIKYCDRTFVLSLITYHVNCVKKEKPNNTKTTSLDKYVALKQISSTSGHIIS
jgi:hypothetical protein